jgi:hypothetical protein
MPYLAALEMITGALVTQRYRGQVQQSTHVLPLPALCSHNGPEPLTGNREILSRAVETFKFGSFAEDEVAQRRVHRAMRT